MRKVAMTLLTFALGVASAVFFLNGRDAVEGQAQPAAAAGGFSAVANAVGTQDVTGPYEVVKGWPKDISTLPGNGKWVRVGPPLSASGPSIGSVLRRSPVALRSPPGPVLASPPAASLTGPRTKFHSCRDCLQ